MRTIRAVAAFAATVDPVVAKIMVTAYRSYETYRETLGPEAETPAVDYVEKQEGPVKLLTAVERAFLEKIRINFDLQIKWRGGLSLDDVAQDIALQNHLPTLVAGEVEEVLCKLFFSASEIVVSPLVSGDHSRLSSQVGSSVLRVEPNYQEGGWGAPVVVKLARRNTIITEANNYERCVKDFIGAHRRTDLARF